MTGKHMTKITNLHMTLIAAIGARGRHVTLTAFPRLGGGGGGVKVDMLILHFSRD